MTAFDELTQQHMKFEVGQVIPMSAFNPLDRFTFVRCSPPIIGLVGPAGSGKDTVGALLSMVGYEMVALADPLRDEVAEALCVHPAKTPSFDDNAALAHCWEALLRDPDAVYRKPTTPYARVVLQWWGTEYRRSINEHYWINKLDVRIRVGRRYVVTDIRFSNEGSWCRFRGGNVWWIDRRGVERAAGIEGHPSENFEWVRPDKTIHNNGTLRDLAGWVKGAL